MQCNYFHISDYKHFRDGDSGCQWTDGYIFYISFICILHVFTNGMNKNKFRHWTYGAEVGKQMAKILHIVHIVQILGKLASECFFSHQIVFFYLSPHPPLECLMQAPLHLCSLKVSCGSCHHLT